MVVCTLLYIPTLILRLLGEHKAKTYRYKNTNDHFWHATLFWVRAYARSVCSVRY